MGESLDVNYSGIGTPVAVVNLFLGMDGSLGNCRELRDNGQSFALPQALYDRLPSVLDSSLEMHGLNADERERAFARKQTRGTRAAREMQMSVQRASQPQL